jgi:hypothetical protein
VAQENAAADSDDSVVRLSIDAKAVVKVGEFDRGGVTRVETKALDHDFMPDAQITPVGLLEPKTGDLSIYLAQSSATSDCIVDCMEDWWERNHERHSTIKTVVLNLDNGPECNSHRSQFVHRLVQFADRTGVTVKLAYYPPYHSKYNPVERCWARLENHWNGSLIDSIDAVKGFAGSMTWKGQNPFVSLLADVYDKGVKLAKDAWKVVEERLERDANLGRWFVTIKPAPS